MRSGLEIGPDAAAPRRVLIRGIFSRGNSQAYTNPGSRYQQFLPGSKGSLSLLVEDLFRFLGLLDALVQRLLGGLLGLAELALAPQQPGQVEIGLAIRGERCCLAVVLDRQRWLVGEVIALPEREVGLEVRRQDALVQAFLDDRDPFLLAALGVHVQRVEVAVLAFV